MVENDFLGAINTNPYRFQDFGIRTYAMFVNGRQVPKETLTFGTGHEKISVVAYKTLFDGSEIHHSKSGLQETHDMFINGYFMLLFDLTPDLAASEGHASLAENGTIHIQVTFKEALKKAITWLLYLGYDNSVHAHLYRTVTTDFQTRTQFRYPVP